MKESAAWFLLALAVCWLYGPGDLAFVGDNRGQFFVAERAASGVPPHISSISAKNSLSFLLSGSGIFVGRMAGLPDYWSVRLVSILAVALSVGLCWIACYRLLLEEGRRGIAASRLGAHLAALSMLSFSGYMYHGVMGARPKIFLVLFMLLTLLAVIKRRPFWTGVAASLAFLCWQPALAMLLVSLVPLLLWRSRPRALALWVIGVVLTLAAYQAYFVYHGAWREQLFQTFVFAGRYLAPLHTSFATQPERLLRSWRNGFLLLHPAGVFLVLWMAVFWSSLLSRWRTATSFIQDRPASTYLHVCALGAVGFTLYDHQGYPDLFFLIPYLAMATGTAVVAIEAGLGGIGSRLRRGSDEVASESGPPASTPLWTRTIGWSVTLALALIAVTGERRVPRRFGLEDQLKLAAAVEDLAREAEGLYVVNCSHLLALNRRSNWNEYGHFFRGVPRLMLERTSGADSPPWKNGELPDLVIVWGNFPGQISSVLRAKYVRVRTPPLNSQGIRVWRLRQRRRASFPPDETASADHRGSYS